jgi:predicted nucleic acid-binding protein
MAIAYLETTIPSYLTSRPSRDLVTAAHQQLTHDWWRSARHDFDLVVSEAVLAEIREGDSEFSEQRLRIVEALLVLSLTNDVRALVKLYARGLGLHPEAVADVLHIAFAVAYEVDYLVTWNCKHIANGHVIRRLQEINTKEGRATPVIVTPEELLISPTGENL